MQHTDTIDRPPVSEPPSLPPFLQPKRRGGGRWIIVPDICRGECADRIPDHKNNWYTIVYRWMVRIDRESGAIAGITHTSTRTYRQWLETYHTDTGIPPHIGFGGAIVAVPGGDRTFKPRWEDYARATFV